MGDTYEIALQPSAERELHKVPSDILPAIDTAIWRLRSNPRPFGVKKLDKDLYRIRIGKWRVVYAILDEERRVVIVRVARRSEKTYKGIERI